MSREKSPRRLRGAKMFAALSSPCHVARLLGFSLRCDSSFFVVTTLSSFLAQASSVVVNANHGSI
jgi:hypothetical protein